MEDKNETNPEPSGPFSAVLKIKWNFAAYFWFVVNNVIGWVLILASGPIGVVVPGPAGLPLFLIGFAMITLPGKRGLTSRVLRGMPVNPESRLYRWSVGLISLVAPALFLTWFAWLIGRNPDKWYVYLLNRQDWEDVVEKHAPWQTLAFFFYVSTVTLLWIFGQKGYHIINLGVSFVPRIRRKARPWLRRHGFDLLPPRRKRRNKKSGKHEVDEGILQIDDRYQKQVIRTWDKVNPWIQRIFAVVSTVAIFYWLFVPVVQKWDVVRSQLGHFSGWGFVFGLILYSGFLIVFRGGLWHRILQHLGYGIPRTTALKIWSLSEMTKYQPTTVWHFVGRAFLSRKYDIPLDSCMASQGVELLMYLWANLLLGVGSLLVLLSRIRDEFEPVLMGMLLLVPFSLALMHEKVFHWILNRILRLAHKDPMEKPFAQRRLLEIALWNVTGLIWQGLAVYLALKGPLQLKYSDFWMVMGSWSLAWAVGFIFFTNPAGLGIREAVFTGVMYVYMHDLAGSPVASPELILAFMAVIMRVWTILGELLILGIFLGPSREYVVK